MGQVSPFTGQPSGDSGMPPPGFKVQPMEDVNMSDEVESPPPNNRAGFAPLGFFRRAVFQRLLLFSTVKLFVYLYKLYDDCDSTIQFYEKLEVYFFIISVASLIVPPIFYAIYLIGANLAKDDILDGTEIGTKAVNGLLLCPWQIKRHLDVLHFAAQRACMWRTPDQDEEQEQQAMERAADVLEFFEDFYAGFLQIFLQFYIYLGTQKLVETYVVPPEVFKPTTIISSSLCVISMLIAIRRRDDGPLTLVLSFVGWSSLITSRIIAITVAATHFHRFMFLLCLVHVVCMTFWVYRIAMASHCDPNSSTSSESDVASNPRKRLSLAILVFLFFGIPSLLIWPFMFQLREQTRPAIFLFITTVENVFLIGMWLVIELIGNSWQVTGVQMMIFWSVVMTTLGGSFFLLLYVFCKPKYTDQVVLHEIRESRMADAPTVINGNSNNARAYNATQYGIYYEFCDLVFKLPSTQKIGAGLEEITSLQST